MEFLFESEPYDITLDYVKGLNTKIEKTNYMKNDLNRL